MVKKNIWENAYLKFGENLPWCLEQVPEWFKSVVKSGWVKPCKVLDIGCGSGNYANYLSTKGFSVTGIDISKRIISVAKRRYMSNDMIKFKCKNVFKLSSQRQKYDFIYEVSLLHNIIPDKRKQYVRIIYSSLKDNGKLLVCCFSKDDLLFKGKKELYVPEINNTMYPLSRNDIIKLFSGYFRIDKLKKVYFGRANKRKRERFLCLMTKK
jgi:ubiquinone/menaquinone biosynthesis C-methylase UbiE